MTTITAHEDGKEPMAFARRRARRLSTRATLAVVAAATVALMSGSAALAYGPSPFLHRQQAHQSATVEVNRIPHTGGLSKGQIARKADRHQQAINRAATQFPAPDVVAAATGRSETLPIVLSGVALLVAIGSIALVAANGVRIRRSAQASG